MPHFSHIFSFLNFLIHFITRYSKFKTSWDAFWYVVDNFHKFAKQMEDDMEDLLKDTTFIQRITSKNFHLAIVFEAGPYSVLPYKLSIPTIYQCE